MNQIIFFFVRFFSSLTFPLVLEKRKNKENSYQAKLSDYHFLSIFFNSLFQFYSASPTS
jgi:hypothetical protein